jgi:hypothetical protein
LVAGIVVLGANLYNMIRSRPNNPHGWFFGIVHWEAFSC